MLDPVEFLNRLIEKLYVDEIIENPFELIIAKLQQCSTCKLIAGEIERNIGTQVMVWNADRTEAIRLQSLIWGTFACNLEMKSDRKCSNCKLDEQLVNGSFIMKAPPLLLLSTARTSFDSSGMLIKTPVDILVILGTTKYLTSGYGWQSDISTYILVGSINYKGKSSKGGHYVTYLFSPKNNEVYCYDDQ